MKARELGVTVLRLLNEISFFEIASGFSDFRFFDVKSLVVLVFFHRSRIVVDGAVVSVRFPVHKRQASVQQIVFRSLLVGSPNSFVSIFSKAPLE